MTELYSFVVLVAITIGVSEVIKRAFRLDARFIPLVALVVGFILTLVGSLTDITTLTILTGLAVGLSSCGLFDQKKLLNK